jgi:hypothetical protein
VINRFSTFSLCVGDQTIVKDDEPAMISTVVHKDALNLGSFFTNAVRTRREHTRTQWHYGTNTSVSELQLSAICTTHMVSITRIEAVEELL